MLGGVVGDGPEEEHLDSIGRLGLRCEERTGGFVVLILWWWLAASFVYGYRI